MLTQIIHLCQALCYVFYINYVTELSKCGLGYESQVCVTPQPTLALHPPTLPPLSFLLSKSRSTSWLPQRSSKRSELFLPFPFHPHILTHSSYYSFPGKAKQKSRETRLGASQEPLSYTVKQTPRGNILQCKSKKVFTVFASWKNNITFLMRP